MVNDITVERLVAELELHPMSTAKELCRIINGSSDSGIKTKINGLLYRGKGKLFKKDDSQKGAPKWTVVAGSKTLPRTSLDGKPLCSHCRNIIIEGEESRHLHGMCKAFYLT